PYQPGDLWRESNSMSPPYQQSVGRDLCRRSLYTVWKRTAPMPNMLAFDAPSREVCVARRQTTSTPLQALVLLDDPQFVEAARAPGERMLKEGGATGRRPRGQEPSTGAGGAEGASWGPGPGRLGRGADSAGGPAPGEATSGARGRRTDTHVPAA